MLRGVDRCVLTRFLIGTKVASCRRGSCGAFGRDAAEVSALAWPVPGRGSGLKRDRRLGKLAPRRVAAEKIARMLNLYPEFWRYA